MPVCRNDRANRLVATLIVAALAIAVLGFGMTSSVNPWRASARADSTGMLDQHEAAQIAANLGDAFLLDTLSSGKGGGKPLLRDANPYTTADLEPGALRYDGERELWIAKWQLRGVEAPNWDGDAVLTIEILFDNGGILRFADAGLYNPDAVIDERPANPGSDPRECSPLDSGFDGAQVCFGAA